jgi:hypothetical protein
MAEGEKDAVLPDVAAQRDRRAHQATGIVAARLGMTADQADDYLRSVSQALGVGRAELSVVIVDGQAQRMASQAHSDKWVEADRPIPGSPTSAANTEPPPSHA